MAAWAGPQVPFTLDFSAPFLPLIQGPQAFFAGMSQARRNSQEQQNRAEWQQSQQDAAMYGQLGQTLGNSIGNLTMGAVAAHGLRQPPAVGGDVGSPSPSFAEGGGSMSPFAGDMAGGTSAYDPGVSGGSPIAAQPQMDPMRRQMLQGMLAQSLGGPPAGSYLAQQMSADAGAGREFQGEFGMTQPQAQQQGQRIFQSAPAPVQQSMLQSAGLNSASDLTPQHYQRIATDAVQMNQLQMRGNARIQQEVQGETMLQQAQQGQQLVQDVAGGEIEIASPVVADEYQKLVKQGDDGIQQMVSSGVRPEQIAQAQFKVQQQRAAYLKAKSPSTFRQKETNQEKFKKTWVQGPDGAWHVPRTGKSGSIEGYDEIAGPDGLKFETPEDAQAYVNNHSANGPNGESVFVDGKGSIHVKPAQVGGKAGMTPQAFAKFYEIGIGMATTYDEEGSETGVDTEKAGEFARGLAVEYLKLNDTIDAEGERRRAVGPPVPPEMMPPSPVQPQPGPAMPSPQQAAPQQGPQPAAQSRNGGPILREVDGLKFQGVPSKKIGGKMGWKYLPSSKDTLSPNQLLDLRGRAESALKNRNPDPKYQPTREAISEEADKILTELGTMTAKAMTTKGSFKKDAAPQGQQSSPQQELAAIKAQYPDPSKMPPEVSAKADALLRSMGQ